MTPCLDVFVCLRIWKEVKWYLSCSAKHVLEIRGLVVTFIWFAYFLFSLLKLGLWCCYSFNSCLRLVFHHVIGSLLPVFHQKKKKKRPLDDIKTKAAITVTYWLLIKFSFLKLVGIWCWGQWGRDGKIQAAKSCWMLQPLRAEGRLWACSWVTLCHGLSLSFGVCSFCHRECGWRWSHKSTSLHFTEDTSLQESTSQLVLVLTALL